MRPKLIERKEVIFRYIEQYYFENDKLPSERDIVAGTGIPTASVHRFLVEMRESGELSYEGGRRGVCTESLKHISRKNMMPVLGYVACGPDQEEEEKFIEYMHLPECMVGKGEFFALIAKGESMVDAGVNPGDYVIVRRQEVADDGDLVIVLLDGKNNLKKLVKTESGYILRSCNNERSEMYPDIVADLQSRGVVIGVYHSFA